MVMREGMRAPTVLAARLCRNLNPRPGALPVGHRLFGSKTRSNHQAVASALQPNSKGASSVEDTSEPLSGKDAFELDHFLKSRQYSVKTEHGEQQMWSLLVDAAYEKDANHGTALSNESKDRQISNTWLRDHCTCSACVDPITKQRRFDVFALNKRPEIVNYRISRPNQKLTVEVDWDDGHRSTYSLAQMVQNLKPADSTNVAQAQTKEQWWITADTSIHSHPPEVGYQDVMNTKEGLAEWLNKIRLYGFCFVKGCPATNQDTRALIERIGPLMNTHYGLFHEMTADMASKDTAYSEEALEPHNDTTYMSQPVGLQMLHLVSHEGTGGLSQLIDGFRIAQVLRETDPEAARILQEVKIRAHASGNEGISLQPQHAFPVITVDNHSGKTTQIRWNNADRWGHLADPSMHPSVIDKWYDAAAKWNSLVKMQEKEWFYEFKLEPGKPLIFDNWRVMHGRSSFTGSRRMCGGYVDHDYFISRYKTSVMQNPIPNQEPR